ncbi:hypothetical protein LWI28_000317 [Acer negundo]|uniref:Translation elongation factor EF1B beta/delta subunit guanine nucleotide exchange domain-containing protein n=1 Tax=Acer negundo TaxID=4023 RepID=A0AAD5INI1_ACENE|nr:hypothetical protein LWI28_000317 [Acer negundo]
MRGFYLRSQVQVRWGGVVWCGVASTLNLATHITLVPLPEQHHLVKESYTSVAMAVAFYDVNSAAGLEKLDEYLLTRSYITGYQASKDDLTVYEALSKSPSSDYVNASRWYSHIDALLRISGVSAEGSGVVVDGSAPITAEAVATPPVDSKAAAAEDDDDDDVDLFGEETEEEKKAAEERAASIKASTKKKESGKSSVLMDVKPWDDETDMKKLEEAVRSVQMEGLLWGASKLVPVGYELRHCSVQQDLVQAWGCCYRGCLMVAAK